MQERTVLTPSSFSELKRFYKICASFEIENAVILKVIIASTLLCQELYGKLLGSALQGITYCDTLRASMTKRYQNLSKFQKL